MLRFGDAGRAQVTPFWTCCLFFSTVNECVSHPCVCTYRCVYVCACEGLLSMWVEKKGLESEDLGASLDSFIYDLG